MRPVLPAGDRKFWIATMHAACWIIYTGFIYGANKLNKPHTTVHQTIFYVIPLVLVFYASIFWLRRYKKIGAFLSMVTFVGTFLVLALTTYIYLYQMLPSADIFLYQSDKFNDFASYAVLGYVQYYSYALLYFVVMESFHKERELRSMNEDTYRRNLENARLKQIELATQKEKLQIEYAFLRAQVNPHFLYNTLNTLYSQAIEYSDVLASNIVKLSKMMRYSFENIEQEKDMVHISNEIKNLQRLIDINDIRYDNNKLVEFKIEGEMSDHMVPPLSLITIVENAFKYGHIEDPLHPIVIRLKLTEHSIYFFCKNKVRLPMGEERSHQIGLANLKKRLQFAFDDNYEIKTRSEDGYYFFELIIKI